MESIALGYLGLEEETIKNLHHDNTGSEAFNRSVLRYWRKNIPKLNKFRLVTVAHVAAAMLSSMILYSVSVLALNVLKLSRLDILNKVLEH